MSGASSAFLNGHLADRERTRLRRKDLELSELIDLCSQPKSMQDRVDTLKRHADAYPELRLFLLVAYYYKDAFRQLRELGPLDYIPSKVAKGAGVETITSMWSQVIRLYDSFPTSPKAKRAIAQQLLSSIHKDDAVLIHSLIEGKFYKKELNERVVSEAFPKDVPQNPKR